MTAAPAPVPAPAAGTGRLAGRSAHWFPPALFGALVALSVPLHSAPPVLGWAAYGTGAAARSFNWSPSSGSSANGTALSVTVHLGDGPAGVAEGWYWAAALTIGFLLTALWYRRATRRTGTPAPRILYLIAGLVLTGAATVLPLLAVRHVPFPAWSWLTGQWADGTLALLAVAVGLGLLARQMQSRALGITVLAFTAASLAVNWPAIRGDRPALSYRGGDPWRAVLASSAQPLLGAAAPALPALALLAGAAVLLIRRPPGAAEPRHDR